MAQKPYGFTVAGCDGRHTKRFTTKAGAIKALRKWAGDKYEYEPGYRYAVAFYGESIWAIGMTAQELFSREKEAAA
jgi:hypothetical protein